LHWGEKFYADLISNDGSPRYLEQPWIVGVVPFGNLQAERVVVGLADVPDVETPAPVKIISGHS
jgi:hypothetical protein